MHRWWKTRSHRIFPVWILRNTVNFSAFGARICWAIERHSWFPRESKLRAHHLHLYIHIICNLCWTYLASWRLKNCNRFLPLTQLLNFWLIVFLCSCWQVMPATSVHRQTLSACSWPDDWCRVWSSYGEYWWQTDQATDLGHSALSSCFCFLISKMKSTSFFQCTFPVYCFS